MFSGRFKLAFQDLGCPNKARIGLGREKTLKIGGSKLPQHLKKNYIKHQAIKLCLEDDQNSTIFHI